MYKHTEVAERLGFSRQALDKHRKQLEQQLGHELGSIQGNARVYSTAELLQLRAQLPESKQAGIDRILSAIAIVDPAVPGEIAASSPFEMEVLPTSKFARFNFDVSQVPENAAKQANQIGDEAKSANADALSKLRQLNRQQAQILGSIIGKEFVEEFETAKHEIIGKHVKKHGLEEAS